MGVDCTLFSYISDASVSHILLSLQQYRQLYMAEHICTDVSTAEGD